MIERIAASGSRIRVVAQIGEVDDGNSEQTQKWAMIAAIVWAEDRRLAVVVGRWCKEAPANRPIKSARIRPLWAHQVS